ncbi:ABC transporter [Mycobacterium xenopi RIVM700367]|uniref:ATP-binding cassette domain-containing protein n=1 Tax=Mycobacterium xenopi TaxID=1789 RepID=UPI00025ACD8D|nr:ATP-binding cassette domain-containing protein [Mycobacterium xenopi]EID15507.1 ABC transporter [Mycobacterium xenopi RIVM700367]
MIELRDLAIGYRRRRRIGVVAADLRGRACRGELTVLLGPNGCGKSTLIRTLCRLQPALAGQALLDGEDLTELAPDELARRVAVVLTDRFDPGLLSARELVGLGRIPHVGVTARLTRDDHAVIDGALRAVGAAHLADRPAADLSDGERQRVLIARALAQQPSVLLLDEPTAFLDVGSRAGLVEMLRSLARNQHLAIVMSTHDLDLALRVADRVWLLGPDGTLVDAIPEDLMLSGRIGSVFDSDTVHFDPSSGMFVVRNSDGRCVRGAHRCAPRTHTIAMLAELATLNPYFVIGTGPRDQNWRPVCQLYTDTEMLGGIVSRVQARIDTSERRVAVSTFFFDFAARLWSVGLGALVSQRLLIDLPAEQLLFRETDGRIELHIDHPVAWEGDDLEPMLADTVLTLHLGPLTAALRRLGPISVQLLRGNTASALLGAARVLGDGAALSARRLCGDQRLSGAIRFDKIGYRRTSCCLYYRTKGGGLCGDCVFTTKPRQRRKVTP